uniref:Uncharacterized protein n=1 Tax=Peronospora matthiolae TaxID=2874970 RepID=A0AAV1VNR9_9STRA
MFLSPDRDLSPGSPDLGGHTPAVPDRPGSPRHLGPTGSPTNPTGSPDRQPTRPSSPSRDSPSRSPERGWYAPIVPDQHESLSNPRSVGSLSTDAELSDRSSEPFPLPTPPAAPDASRSDIPAANESRERSAPAVGVTGFVPRVSADDVRLTMATISYLWDREATFCSQADTIHALQQSYRDAVARGDRLQDELDSLYRSAAPFVSFVQRRYDWMQGRYVDAVHSLSDCNRALRTYRDQSEEIRRLRTLICANDEAQGNLERQVDALRAQLHSLQAELNSLRQQRDQLTMDSDLIQQVDGLTPLEGQLALSQAENANLRRQLAEHLEVHDQLQVVEHDRDQAIAEHRALLDTLNSAILGSRSSALTARSTPKSATPAGSPPAPTTPGSRSLARRSRSRSSGPPAKRRRIQPRSRSSDSTTARVASRLLSLNPLMPLSKLPGLIPPEPPPNSSCSPLLSAASGTGSGSEELTESDSSSDDLTRAALSQSRSAARRQPRSDARSSTPNPSPAARVVPASPAATALAQALLRSPSPDVPEPRYLSYPSTPVAAVPVVEIQDNGGVEDVEVSPTGETHSETGSVSPPPESTALSDRHSSDSENSITLPARQVANRVFSSVDFDNLPPLQQPRDRWIPNYLAPSRRVASEIAPWSVSRIAMVCVRTMTIELLFHHYSKPRNFLFPFYNHGRAPPTGTWASGLISRQHIEALYATAPWDNIIVPVNPISFTMTGWYRDMSHRYLELESTHRQALWESTHAFPIPPAQRRSERFMQTFWRQRKQRRSRFGARWKNFLKMILSGMIAGHCDLDILLDPFFLHYPRPHEDRVWYPGLGHSNDPADLLEALDMADQEDPWRNQFRNAYWDHPGSQIPRLQDKFKPAPSS